MAPTNRKGGEAESQGAKAPTGQRRASAGGTLKVITPASRDYELPIVHLRVPDTAVQVAFWGGLTGAVVLGAVDVPLAALVGLGVVIARHRRA